MMRPNPHQQFQQRQQQQRRQMGYAWQQQQKLKQQQFEAQQYQQQPVRRRNEFFATIKAIFIFVVSLAVPGAFIYGGAYFVTLALTDSEDLANMAFFAGVILAFIVASINARTVYND